MNSQEFQKSIAEYLYVDENRLDSYFQQIASSLTAFDKTREVKASLSFTSIGVEASQNTHPRPVTCHEKIRSLLDYLQKREIFLDGVDAIIQCMSKAACSVMVPSGQNTNSFDFHFASFESVRVCIPSKHGEFSIWIGKESVRGFSPVGRYTRPPWVSFILMESNNTIDKDVATRSSHGSPYHDLLFNMTSQFISAEDGSLDLNRMRESQFHHEIRNIVGACINGGANYLSVREFQHNNPSGGQIPSGQALRDMDATVFMPRRIAALYRTRKVALNGYPEEWSDRGIGEVFAYPVFIAALP